MAAELIVLAYVLLVGLVSKASPQRTYQRACDCEYMVNGKCAYTLLLPTGNNDGTCSGSGSDGGGSETVDYYLRNVTNRVNNLYEIAMNQSLLLGRLQDSVIQLQRSGSPQPPPPPPPTSAPLNDSTAAAWQAMLLLLNATVQSEAKELNQLNTTMQMLALNLTALTTIVQMQAAQMSNLSVVLNQTRVALEKRADDDDAQMSRLNETIGLLRQVSCYRRAALFSGPDRLNGTSISFSSVYGNDTTSYGPQQLAINNTGAGAWCPQEPRQPQEWIQFDIGRSVAVFGIATRGRGEYDQWVANYSIQYVPNSSSSSSNGSLAGDALDWVYFNDVAGVNQIFQGNTDTSSLQLNLLWRPIVTRYIRLLPLIGGNNGNVCTKADVIGCVDESY